MALYKQYSMGTLKCLFSTSDMLFELNDRQVQSMTGSALLGHTHCRIKVHVYYYQDKPIFVMYK